APGDQPGALSKESRPFTRPSCDQTPFTRAWSTASPGSTPSCCRPRCTPGATSQDTDRSNTPLRCKLVRRALLWQPSTPDSACKTQVAAITPRDASSSHCEQAVPL